jgi:uncharacterized protein (TIGR03083 family)
MGDHGPVTLDHLAALARSQDRFATVLAGADPEAPVACCAPWRVADLALHLGGVHWWAAAMALGVDLDAQEPSAPRETAALVAFYTWAAAHLRATLAEVGPDAPALTLLGPGTAGFWRRRQLHETAVHLWDLSTAAGAGPDTLGDDVWADAVAEVVDTMTPRQVRLGRIEPLPYTVELAAPGRTWRLGPDRAADVTVHGSPRDLALMLWKRVAPGADGLVISGDAAALVSVLALRLTP